MNLPPARQRLPHPQPPPAALHPPPPPPPLSPPPPSAGPTPSSPSFGFSAAPPRARRDEACPMLPALPEDRATRLATPSAFCHHYGHLCHSPASSISGESMKQRLHTRASREPPAQAPSPGATGHTAEALGRLSFEHRRTVSREHLATQRGRVLYPECHPLASKRSASRELVQPGGRQSPRLDSDPKHAASTWATRCRAQRRPCPRRITSFDHNSTTALGDNHHVALLPSATPGSSMARLARDSTHDSGYGSRQNTGRSAEAATIPCALGDGHDAKARELAWLAKPRAESRYTTADGQRLNMVLQPSSSPISTEQLAAEVKAIYAGLVMVEAKCINIDAAQAADPTCALGAEQWQALIALHRTLLYEHHDFLMATQHPSATPALRGLAIKYSMPARMWKHGIHAFLEVLRHRRPQSQDYMLAFIYLAYQMMALLFETVPSFTDTWIECLGDLARYRMAIEEEREAHATWGGVAARWYTMASDRHPAIGRLYHHLGILERPSLRKFCFYSKSLTCVVPFANARDSLSTLCAPIVHDKQTIQSSRQSAEARIVTYHALVVTRRDLSIVGIVQQDSLQLLGEQPAKLRDFGAYFAATNIAALLQLGNAGNKLLHVYHAAIEQAAAERAITLPPGYKQPNLPASPPDQDSLPDPYFQSSTVYFADSFNYVLRHYCSAGSIKDSLSYVHVTMAYFHSLFTLRSRLNYDGHIQHAETGPAEMPYDLGWLDLIALSSFLTTLAQADHPITARTLECARQKQFLASDHHPDEHTEPLSEDYVIRGHVWSQFYFSSGWFDGQGEDDGRAIETSSMMKARAARVLWLGLFLAFHTELLSYDVQSQVFSPALSAEQEAAMVEQETALPESYRLAEADMTSSTAVETTSVLLATSPTGTNGSSDSSEDGFTVVKRQGRTGMKNDSSPNGARGKAEVAESKTGGYKQPMTNAFQVVDENGEIRDAEGQMAEI